MNVSLIIPSKILRNVEMTKYQHDRTTSIGSTVREVVFGMEDGMVSTLGAVTGIAIGSQDHYMVVLSGVIIIAVESISMGIGSYLSNQSEYEVNQQRIEEEKEEIEHFPQQEKRELLKMFRRDGWPDDLAEKMAQAAADDPNLMLNEMVYRELLIPDESSSMALKNGLFMFFSYIAGGLCALAAYFVLPIPKAMPLSVVVTLVSLFGLGVLTTKYSKVSWWKAGGRVLLLGLVALLAGYAIGSFAQSFQ